MIGVDALVIAEIAEDDNFVTLSEDHTGAEEFARLVGEHVIGYSQKKRLSEGLKDLLKKIEDAEQRLIVAKNVGKFREPDPKDKALTEDYSAFELKQKTQILTVELQSMIDQGLITFEEKPRVLDNLRTRLAKAKEGGKAKLEEKLDGMMTTLVRGDSHTLPVANMKEFDRLEKELASIQKLEKLPARNLTAQLREKIGTKEALQADFDALMDISHMWFETVIEFKPRLYAAITAYQADEEARKKREEQEAFEQKLAEDEAILEKKRAAVAKKEAEAGGLLDEKLKAHRLEAAARPVKEIQEKVVKEKRVMARVDLQQMHHVDQEYDEVSAAEIQAELDHAKAMKEREFAKAYAELNRAMRETDTQAAKESSSAGPATTAEEVMSAQERLKKSMKDAQKSVRSAVKVSAVSAAKGRPAAAAVKPESPRIKAKTEEEIAAAKEERRLKEEANFKAVQEKLERNRLERASQPQAEKKAPAPKKEKQASVKMSLLDFYDEDLVLERLAEQQALEANLKAKAEALAASQMTTAEAEEAAAWAAEEAAWEAGQTKVFSNQRDCYGNPVNVAEVKAGLNKARTAAGVPDAKAPPKPVVLKAVAPALVTQVAKPKRKPPVERACLWGKPAGGEAAADDDGEDIFANLVRQEAIEKKERAVAEAQAAKEYARQEAVWEAEQNPAAAAAAAAAAPSLRVVSTARVVPASVPRNESIVDKAERIAAKPAVKRKPVELVSKWGATPVYVSPLVADGEGEDEDEALEEPQEKEEAADEEAADEEAADEEAADEEAADEEAADEETKPEEVEEEDAAEAVEEAKPVAEAKPMSANPSLAESMKSGIKKTPGGPAPKKKEKKKWGKADASLMGFEY